MDKFVSVQGDMSFPHYLLLAWLALTNVLAFVLFAWDKARAVRSKSRVSELHLFVIGALGGWPGGLLAMLLLRHKTAKSSFVVKYAVAFLVWAGLMYLAARWLGLV